MIPVYTVLYIKVMVLLTLVQEATEHYGDSEGYAQLESERFESHRGYRGDEGENSSSQNKHSELAEDTSIFNVEIRFSDSNES